MNQSYYDYADTVADWWGDSYDKPGPKCECGVEITYGDAVPPEYHSPWCPKSPNYKGDSNDNV